MSNILLQHSSGMRPRVVWLIGTDVSEEVPTASIRCGNSDDHSLVTDETQLYINKCLCKSE
jgi:hypothetical protein